MPVEMLNSDGDDDNGCSDDLFMSFFKLFDQLGRRTEHCEVNGAENKTAKSREDVKIKRSGGFDI